MLQTRLGKKILVVEGPAGSGKSFLSRHLSESLKLYRAKSSLSQRSFDSSVEPAVQSAVNDYLKVLWALAHQDYAVLIERLCVSQMVYGCLRNEHLAHNQQRLGYQFGNLAPEALQGILNLALVELSWRNYPLFIREDDIRISWLFVLPSDQQIDEQRQTTGKEYPWPAAWELKLYDAIARDMTQAGHDVLIFSNKPEQLSRITKTVARWQAGEHDAKFYETWKDDWK